MVVRARARIAAVVVLALAGCFNPSGTDPTGADPTGADTSTTATSGGQTATVTGTSDGPTTDVPLTSTAPTTAVTTTTPGGCGSDSDCPKETPNCEFEECVGCDDADGCTAAAPFCDGGVCRGCLYHEECSKACDIAEGACFPANTLEYVVVPSPNCGLCGEGQPCCSIKQALQTSADEPEKYVRISLESMGAEDVGVVIDPTYPDKVVALVGNGQNPVIAPTVGPAFELLQAGPDKRVYLWRLHFAGNMGATGVRCDGGDLWLDRVVIDGFGAGFGLSAASCALSVRRSSITANNGAISIIDSPLVLRDSVVGGSPGSATELTLGAGSELDARYTTVVDEVGGQNGLLTCAGTVPITFENSIVVSTDELTTAAGCVVSATRSVLSPGVSARPGADIVSAVVEDLAFTGDYRLMAAGGPAAGLARWYTGYSPVDIDGTARPTVDDSPDYAGAHIPLN